MIKTIGVLTSGGDSQGMNAAISGVVKTALAKGIETFLIHDGYYGLVNNMIKEVTAKDIENIMKLGGTIIGSARLPEFKEESVRQQAIKNLNAHDIEALVVIGGDGSYQGAQKLTDMGINCIGIPGTVDNDITCTDYTIGFDTAINIVVEAIDRVRDTMQSHNRCAIIEVMGRHCGDIALYGGIAGEADIISISDRVLTEEEILERVNRLKAKNKRSVVIVVSELLYDDLNALSKFIEEGSGYVTRPVVLGHTQRGGTPSAMDRYRAFRMGQFAVDQLIDGKGGLAVCLKGDELITLEIQKALAQPRTNRLNIWKEFDNLNKQ